MTERRTGRVSRRLQLVIALVALVAFGAVPAASGQTRGANITVTWNKVFTSISTLDLQTSIASQEVSIIGHACYDTLLTFKGSDFSTLVPDAATSWNLSKDAQTLTFQLRKNVKFSDGTPMTSADVVFTINRFVNIKGPFSFWLAGTTAVANGPYGVTLNMSTPNPAAPYILAHPFLGILNSKVVMANGGTAAPDAATADHAASFFQSHTAGSGPYILSAAGFTTEFIFDVNPNSWRYAPAVTRVILDNVPAATQQFTLQNSSHQIDQDISSIQVPSLQNNKNIVAKVTTATNVFFFGVSKNKTLSPVTANKHIENAIRYAIDYKGLLAIAGPGSIQAPGIVAQGMLGALPRSDATRQDITKAKAELAKAVAEGINPSFSIDYPSGFQSAGVVFQSVAEKIASDLNGVGFKITLSGAPITTWVPKWSAGQSQALASQYPIQYPDPSQYNVFLPGYLIAARFGWQVNTNRLLESLGREGFHAVTPKGRANIFQQLQRKENAAGCIYPLFQPPLVVAYTADLRNVNYNPVWVGPSLQDILPAK